MANESQRTSNLFFSSQRLRKNRIQSLLDNVFVQFLAFGMLVAAVVAILVGGVDDGDRQIDDSMIGQVAPFPVEATHDFTYTEKDVTATSELREEVAMSVPPVYDWEEHRVDVIGDNIEEAFGQTRQTLAERARDHLQPDEPDSQQDDPDSQQDDPDSQQDDPDSQQDDPEWLQQIERHDDETFQHRQLIDRLAERQPEQLLRFAHRLRGDNFDEPLGAQLSDAEFEVFAEHSFHPDAESTLRAVIEEVMSRLILEDASRIEDQIGEGIYLRRLHDDESVIEYHITDLEERFVSLAEAERLVEDAVHTHAVGLDSQLRDAVQAAAIALLEPNTSYNDGQTREKRHAARDSVPDQMIREDFREGQVIVDEGHVITERDFRIIDQMIDEDDTHHATQVIGGIALFGLLLLIVIYGFGRRNIRRFRPGPRDIVFMGTTLLLMLLITRVGATVGHALAEQVGNIPVEAWYFAIPVAAGGMLIRLVLESEHAILFTVLFGVLVGVIADNSLFFAAYTIMGTLVGVTTVQQVKHRMALMWSGLAVGAVNAAAIVGFLLFQGELFQLASIAHVLLGFGGGVAAGFFISAVLPVFESVFGYTTDIKLLELANLNHPLLRELILRAPGSYHHSMMVGSLCEAAAEAVDANALLARVGSYYHDIGKAKNPQYFAENQTGENPHDKLKPNMSALIIKSHVKDGLDMARKHRLPSEIQDFIAQHHGTSLIAYFYHRAKEAEDPDIPEVTEKDFRYPGPKPQSRETAICLLADGVEAASRAMANPSPARLKGLVQTMINRAFTDGQLDECDLTLKDLNKIARAFTRILTGVHHHRPEYPDDKQPKDTTGTVRHKTHGSEDDDLADDDQEHHDAHPDSNNGSTNGSSEDRDSQREDHETPRGDLPRLGSS